MPPKPKDAKQDKKADKKAKKRNLDSAAPPSADSEDSSEEEAAVVAEKDPDSAEEVRPEAKDGGDSSESSEYSLLSEDYTSGEESILGESFNVLHSSGKFIPGNKIHRQLASYQNTYREEFYKKHNGKARNTENAFPFVPGPFVPYYQGIKDRVITKQSTMRSTKAEMKKSLGLKEYEMFKETMLKTCMGAPWILNLELGSDDGVKVYPNFAMAKLSYVSEGRLHSKCLVVQREGEGHSEKQIFGQALVEVKASTKREVSERLIVLDINTAMSMCQEKSNCYQEASKFIQDVEKLGRKALVRVSYNFPHSKEKVQRGNEVNLFQKQIEVPEFFIISKSFKSESVVISSGAVASGRIRNAISNADAKLACQTLVAWMQKNWYTQKDDKQITEPDHLYTDDQINDLLKNKLLEGAIPISAAAFLAEPLEALNLYLGDLSENQVIVIPVNVNGNHWTGLVISLIGGVFQGIYVDPFGNSMPPRLERALSNILNINTLYVVQQTNGFDCGPLTVENLAILAQAIINLPVEVENLPEYLQLFLPQDVDGVPTDQMRREHDLVLRVSQMATLSLEGEESEEAAGETPVVPNGTDLVCVRAETVCDNPILNSLEGIGFLKKAVQVKEPGLTDLVIDLGKEHLEELLMAVKKDGSVVVLYRLLGKEVASKEYTVKTETGDLKKLVTYADEEGNILYSEVNGFPVLSLTTEGVIQSQFFSLIKAIGSFPGQIGNLIQQTTDLIQKVVDLTSTPEEQADSQIGLLSFLMGLFDFFGSGVPMFPGGHRGPNPDDEFGGGGSSGGEHYHNTGSDFIGEANSTNSTNYNEYSI